MQEPTDGEELFNLSPLEDRELEPSPFGDLQVAPYSHDFGTDPPIELSSGGLKFQTSEHIQVFDLRELVTSVQGLPPRYPLYRGYEVLLIVHRFRVLRTAEKPQMVAAGYEVESDAADLMSLDLLPREPFIRADDSGALHCTAILGNEGLTDDPGDFGPMDGGRIRLAGDLRLDLSRDAGVFGRISFPLLSRNMQVLGVGGSRCTWHFSGAFAGEQILVQTAIIFRGERRVRFKTRGYVLIKSPFSRAPGRRETRWVEKDCQITRSSSTSWKPAASIGSLAAMTPRNKKIFVVHGRDHAAVAKLCTFLSSIGLHPRTFIDVASSLGGAPSISEIIRAGMEEAQAVLVLFTGDERAVLDSRLEAALDSESDRTRIQARPNVIFEAGLALGSRPNQTILVSLGADVRLFSDVHGYRVIALSEARAFEELRGRLEATGCELSRA